MIQPHWPLKKPLSQMKTCQDWRDNGNKGFCRLRLAQGHACLGECQLDLETMKNTPILVLPEEMFPPSCEDVQESVYSTLKKVLLVVAIVVGSVWYWSSRP